MRTTVISYAVAWSLSLTLFPLSVHAAKQPRALITDYRVKQIAYDPNQVYEVVGTYGYQTALEFGSDEQIKVVALGDTIGWQAVPNQSELFLKPVEANAATNLTVITNKHKYYFNLSSAKSPNRSAMTFIVRFVYPGMNRLTSTIIGNESKRGYTALDTVHMNMEYGVSGNKAKMGLKQVFDDGQFTYFMFDKDAEIPAFYIVGADGTESLVDWRREGPYMVVERVGKLFTLRNGDIHLCVKNTAGEQMASWQRYQS